MVLVLFWLLNLHGSGSGEVTGFKWSQDALVNGSLDNRPGCRWSQYLHKGGGSKRDWKGLERER